MKESNGMLAVVIQTTDERYPIGEADARQEYLHITGK
jgi:hypothetical protein